MLCHDCNVDTAEIHEYYMVENSLWREAGSVDGFLCISCLESRIGRELTHDDFPLFGINYMGRRSQVLASRLCVKVDKLGRHRPMRYQGNTYWARYLATRYLMETKHL